MPVLVGGKSIIPAPFVSFSKEYQTAEDGRQVGSVWVITVRGKMVAYKGSPNSAGAFHTGPGYPADEVKTHDQMMASLLRKQEALRKLLSAEGQTVEIAPLDGSTPVKFNPRVRKPFDVPEGNWVEYCDYTITFEADVVDGLNMGAEDAGDVKDYKVSRAGEEWNIEAGDESGQTYRLTHSVSATGKRFYDETGALTKQAWENAKDYVLNKIGLGLKAARMEAPGVLNASSLQAYNYVRSQQVGELSGTFQVTETWLCYDPQGQPPAVEEYNVSVRVQENGITQVGIEGQVRGLEVRDNTTRALVSSRYDNAKAKWEGNVRPNLKARAENISGVTLHATPLTQQTGLNEISGVVTYQYEYSNRAGFSTPGALAEVVRVSDSHPADVFASLPVLGAPLGPVLQPIGTVTARRRQIFINIRMPAATQAGAQAQPSTNALVATYQPAGSQVFLDQDEETWSDREGEYTRQVGFTWKA
jgi:hypothetical protein